jgi:hypothetical protein
MSQHNLVTLASFSDAIVVSSIGIQETSGCNDNKRLDSNVPAAIHTLPYKKEGERVYEDEAGNRPRNGASIRHNDKVSFSMIWEDTTTQRRPVRGVEAGLRDDNRCGRVAHDAR